jgi:hypothetical protein
MQLMQESCFEVFAQPLSLLMHEYCSKSCWYVRGVCKVPISTWSHAADAGILLLSFCAATVTADA